MKISIIKQIAFVLLAFLALSCSGLSLGMITHSVTSIMPGMDMNESMHACCGLDTNQVNTSETGTMLHDTVQIIAAQDQIISFFIAVLSSIVFFSLGGIHVYQNVLLYMRRWGRQISYIALLYKRLFASGLLHSKVL